MEIWKENPSRWVRTFLLIAVLINYEVIVSRGNDPFLTKQPSSIFVPIPTIHLPMLLLPQNQPASSNEPSTTSTQRSQRRLAKHNTKNPLPPAASSSSAAAAAAASASSSSQQTIYDTLRGGESPKYTDTLHRCRDAGEAYSAAYLISKEHLLYQFTDYNLTWVNCEMGSFIMMNGRAQPHKNANGSLLQSRDVLDFSVIHLSAYERLLLRWARSAPAINADKNNITAVAVASQLIQSLAIQYRHTRGIPPAHSAFNRTVVIMPYLGVDRGAGHSKLYNRQVYLSACFWSFYQYFPFIVAGVKSEKDRDYILKSSGLPFYDVMLLENMPKSASIPVATVQETKRRIHSGNWSFDYVFFTESDQILMMRIPDEAFEYIDHFPRHLIIPHRLMAYPITVLQHFHKRAINEDAPLLWFNKKCVLPLQYCEERKEWVHVSNASVPILNIYGIQVPLGNSDFHRESYRTCRLLEE